MTDNTLKLLGLALRGGNLAVGEEPVREACKTRRARLVLTAADAAQNSADRSRRWAEEGGAAWVRLPWDRETLGAALGRKLCAVAALTDQGLAAALAEKLRSADREPRSVPEPCPASASNDNKKSRAEAKRPAVPET